MSERKFNVGDRVRVNSPSSPHHGKETSVTGGPLTCQNHADPSDFRSCYEVDLPNPYQHQRLWPRAWFVPEFLVLIYDGHEKVSWSSCEWQPKKVRT